MAIRFTEGFDLYSVAEDTNRKWDLTSNLSSSFLTVGRLNSLGGQSLVMTNGESLITPTLTNAATYIVGFAFLNVNRTDNSMIVRLRDGSTTQVEVFLNGTVTVRVNETNEIVLTNQDTLVSANAQINNVMFLGGAGATQSKLDDIVILDTSGSINTDLLGDVKIETLQITGDGNGVDWDVTPGVDRFMAVREPYNGSIIGSSVANEISQFTKENLLKLSANIKCVVTNIVAKNTDASNHVIRDNMRISTTDYPAGANQTITSTAYQTKQFIREVNPATSAAWANAAAVNSAQVGVELIS